MVIPLNTSTIKDDDDKDIPQISPCFHVTENSNLALKKSARLQLPLDGVQDEDPGEYTTCLLRWKGINVEVAKRDMMTNGGMVATEVGTFSGYSAASISERYLMSATSSAMSMKLLLKAGRLNICKILTFVDQTDKNSLWFECVLKEKANDVVWQNERKGLLYLPKSESPDLHLFDGHKVRIFPEGNIKLARGFPKSKNILVFLSSGEDNHITFPVEKKHAEMSAVPYAVLNFESASRHWQKTLHTFHYLHERDWKKQGTVLPVVDFYTMFAPDPIVKPTIKVEASPRAIPAISQPIGGHSKQAHVHVNTKDTIGAVRQRVKSETSLDYSRSPATPLAHNKARRKTSQASSITAKSSASALYNKPQDGAGIFSDKSLLALCRALPPRHTTHLGVELGLSTTDIERMKSDDKTQEEVTLAIIKKTVINKKSSRREKLDKLCLALDELDFNHFSCVLKEHFASDECLRRKDFGS